MHKIGVMLLSVVGSACILTPETLDLSLRGGFDGGGVVGSGIDLFHHRINGSDSHWKFHVLFELFRVLVCYFYKVDPISFSHFRTNSWKTYLAYGEPQI